MKKLSIYCVAFLIFSNLIGCEEAKVIDTNDRNSKINKNSIVVSKENTDTYKNYKKELEDIKNEEDLNRVISKIEYSNFEYEFEDGSKLTYIAHGKISIMLSNEDDIIKNISISTLSSKPYISPDKKRFVFIDPNEADCPGNLYLYDKDEHELKTLIKFEYPKGTNTPKRVRWVDDRFLLVVIGYGYGTHNFGGNLYIYDLQSNEVRNVEVLKSSNEEIRLIEVIDNIIFVTIFNFENKGIINIELNKDELFSRVNE